MTVPVGNSTQESPPAPTDTNLEGGTAISAPPSAWSNIERVFGSELYRPDMIAVRIVYSAIAAHYLPGAPVWIFDVAPPSSGKTEKLMPLKPAVGAHIILTVTPQTFISGWTWRGKNGKPDRD